MLRYEFTIESDFEPDTEDIRRTIGLHAIHVLPGLTNGRLTRVSPNDVSRDINSEEPKAHIGLWVASKFDGCGLAGVVWVQKLINEDEQLTILQGASGVLNDFTAGAA